MDEDDEESDESDVLDLIDVDPDAPKDWTLTTENRFANVCIVGDVLADLDGWMGDDGRW